MTYQSDLVRLTFHKLPTEVQMLYMKMEEMLAHAGKHTHIVGVMSDGSRLEVVMHILGELDSNSGRPDCGRD